MGGRGAEFSDVYPRNTRGQLDALTFTSLQASASGLDDGVIQQITPNGSFRPGQQVIFYLGVANPLGGAGEDQWVSRLRLKPWWARPNSEMRQAFGGDGSLGSVGAIDLDTQVFGGGPNAGLSDNRYVWVPGHKRLDITQFDTAPPPVAPARHSDSLMLQDMWTVDLQDPNDAAYAAKFAAPQVPARWIPILYPAMGYALGFTYEATMGNQGADPIVPQINLQWMIGTMAGAARDQESIG